MTKLNEISKKSLYSYIGKANKDAYHQEKKSMHSGYSNETKAKALKQRHKRVAGMMKAMRKIHENKESLTETSYDKNLNPNKPIVVSGVMGTNSKRFKKRFVNMIAFEKWSDNPEAENYDIQYITNEEILDEISKNTLKSYLSKAKIDRDKSEIEQAANLHSVFRDHDPKEPLKKKVEKDKVLNQRINNRYKGMDAAKYRLVMQKEENLDELSTKFLRSYISKSKEDGEKHKDKWLKSKAKEGEPHRQKAIKRLLGRDRARLKLQRRPDNQSSDFWGEERLDELSKKTLGSYIKKASFQRGQNMLRGGRELEKDSEAAAMKHLHKAAKRNTGINKAVDKLTKEEKTFTITDIEKIDDILIKYEHNMKNNKVTMKDEDYQKFMAEIRKKNIKL